MALLYPEHGLFQLHVSGGLCFWSYCTRKQTPRSTGRSFPSKQSDLLPPCLCDTTNSNHTAPTFAESWQLSRASLRERWSASPQSTSARTLLPLHSGDQTSSRCPSTRLQTLNPGWVLGAQRHLDTRPVFSAAAGPDPTHSCTLELSSQRHHEGTTWPSKLLEGFLEPSPRHPSHGDVPTGCWVPLRYSTAADLLLPVVCRTSQLARRISKTTSPSSLLLVVQLPLTTARSVMPARTFWTSCLPPHKKDLTPFPGSPAAGTPTHPATWDDLEEGQPRCLHNPGEQTGSKARCTSPNCSNTIPTKGNTMQVSTSACFQHCPRLCGHTSPPTQQCYPRDGAVGTNELLWVKPVAAVKWHGPVNTTPRFCIPGSAHAAKANL